MKQDELIRHFHGRRPVITIVLDGWGIGHHDEGDAIHLARKPAFDELWSHSAHTTVLTHGPYVGLPSMKDIGGSEVGHSAMGAGRILPQGAKRINNAIADGTFFKSEVLVESIDHCLSNDAPLHLIGLFSDGNVHSHVDHFHAVIDHAVRQGVRRLYVHALLDGRDVPVQSALDYVEPMEAKFAEINRRHEGWDYRIASGGGREVITMDRDTNWPKVERGWQVHVRGQCENRFTSASVAIEQLRKAKPDIVDQDLPPFVVVDDDGHAVGPMDDGHAAIFMNFRGDRAIEFSQAMVEDEFDGFDRGDRPAVLYAGMMTYDEDTNLPPRTLCPAGGFSDGFGRRILEAGLTQFRLAETQKYAHVTFFFNGGYREPLDRKKETYHLIPSDKVDSFAEAPAMKALEIGRKAREFIRSGKYDYGLINFANTDMVGHTGNLQAAVKAVEAVDQALRIIMDALKEVGGLAIITADHGNADEMVSENPKSHKREMNTRHSLNPVPAILYDPAYDGPRQYRLRPNDPESANTLGNLAATSYILLGLTPPDELDRPLFELD